MVIQGEVKGTVSSREIVIAEDAKVSAELRALHVDISGSFDGLARVAGTMTIRAAGRVSGKVRCKNVVVEPGGVLDAEIASSNVDGEPQSD